MEIDDRGHSVHRNDKITTVRILAEQRILIRHGADHQVVQGIIRIADLGPIFLERGGLQIRRIISCIMTDAGDFIGRDVVSEYKVGSVPIGQPILVIRRTFFVTIDIHSVTDLPFGDKSLVVRGRECGFRLIVLLDERR